MDPQLNDRMLRPSQMKLVGLCVLTAILVAAGVFCVRTGYRVIGWLDIAFFGMCIAVFAVMMLPGAGYLRLREDGFEMCSLFRRSYLPWHAVEVFEVGRIGLNKRVVFNLNRDVGMDKARAVARSISGWEGALPDTYGMSAQALADLMNAYHHHARVAAQQPDAADGAPATQPRRS